MNNKREVWQRGPVDGIPALLQPVAHALLQGVEEVQEIMENFPEQYLWQRPGGVASAGLHLQHVTGVLDRLFTYARQEPLSGEQMHSLSVEGDEEKFRGNISTLVENFRRQVDISLKQSSETTTETLTDKREIGRQKIPTTLIGLYVHSAEHIMRHVGQLLVTVRVITSNASALK